MEIITNYTTGYAGTGKSTALLNKLKTLPYDTTVVIAPTHRALARLKPSIPGEIEIKTIHSLLGWIPTINEAAQHIRHIDSTVKLDKSLELYTDIVMLTDLISKLENLGYNSDGVCIDEDIRDSKVVLHCYLDPYQLEPVKGSMIVVDEDNCTNLTTQYRAESPDVVELFTKFVHYIEGSNTTDLTVKYSSNIHKLNIANFKKGDRLLAYTNETVGAWNKAIAKKLGITSYIGQEVQLGSMTDTIVVESIDDIKNIDKLISMYEGGILKLQNSNINKRFYIQAFRDLVSNKNIEFMTATNGSVYPVVIGIYNHYKVMRAAKELAVKNRSKFSAVYALGRAYVMDYTFATTVHKSQGSEFNNVFVDKGDIKRAILPNYYTAYARLMYVAISRCIKNLYIN